MAFGDLMAAFRGRTTGTLPVPTVQNSSTVNPTVPSTETPNPADAANKNTAFGQGGQGSKSPLENFDKLWEIDPNKKAPESPVPTFNNDPTKMMELAGTANFVNHIDPELIARAQKGDGAALMDVINKSAQAGFAHSSLATSKIVETALSQLNDKYETTIIPGILKAERTRNVVAEDNPIFTNPAAKPIVDMVRNQMMEKYPTSTPEAIKTMVAEYIEGFSATAMGQIGKTIVDPKAPVPGANKIARPEQDWEKLLT